MKILAISGSLRVASHNTALLRAAAASTPQGVEIELYEGLEDLPPYNEDRDNDQPPAAVARLRSEIAAADGLLISTPEYNGTVPGQLKHAVDWASRPHGQRSALWGKPATVIGASVTDYGALWAQDHLRKALGLAGARVLDTDFPVGRAHERIGADGAMTDPETIERLTEIVGELADYQHALTEAA